VDTGELSRRAAAFDGWFGPALASVLVEHGYLDELRVQAEAGDWTCAERLAAELAGRDEPDAALEALAPYAATGWWPAVEAVAGVLAGAGRAGEAISLISPLAEAGGRLAVRRLAELLAGAGRVDEVLALLGPRTGDGFLAEALVDLTGGCGRDDEVLRLLPVPVAGGWNAGSWNAAVLRARMLERQGRAGDAMDFLHSRVDAGQVISQGDVRHLADLMARHGQMARLRELAAGRGGEQAACRLADELAGQGNIDQAVEALGPFTAKNSGNAAMKAARLLAGHDRADEGIEVLRPVVAACGYSCGCVVHLLADLLARQGRASETIAVVDGLAAGEKGMTPELFRLRARALHDSGRTGQAITELRAHPEIGDWYLAEELASVLADSGQLDEAADVLRPTISTGPGHYLLAELLIQQGKVKEAVAVIQAPKPYLSEDLWA
jgi:hypothetical protein